ncbi:hypothetical protein RB195_006883 [Necator americanus]|uniref:Secreted protein n=1 Tax=Necator americanus TaxID=51031 RepID=A0ABR1BXW8_NECAM
MIPSVRASTAWHRRCAAGSTTVVVATCCHSVAAWAITLVRSSVTVSGSSWSEPAISRRPLTSEGSERTALFAALPLPPIYLFLRHNWYPPPLVFQLPTSDKRTPQLQLDCCESTFTDRFPAEIFMHHLTI